MSGLIPASAAIHFLPPKGQKARALALFFLILAPFAFGALALALGQDANWDLRNYHWYNAYAILNGRWDIDILPSQTPWFYNPALDVPFYLLATHAPARLAGFALGAVQGLNFILLFMLAHATLTIANPRQKVLAAAGLAALGMAGGGGLALLGTTFYDNVTSLGLFLSAILVVRHHARLFETTGTALWDSRAFASAFLFGVPAGAMMALKLPSVVFCVGLCLAFGSGVLTGLAVFYGCWGWHLQSRFQSPLFPYFNGLFHSPLAPLASARDTQFIPGSLREKLLFPFIIADNPLRAGEIPWRDWRLPILYALLPVAVILRLVFGRSRAAEDAVATPYASRYLLWAAVVSYGAWLGMFCIYRYAVPLEMLAPLLIVLACGMLPLRAQPRALLTLFLLLMVAASVHPGSWGRRTQWLDRYVQAEIPPLGDTSRLMILMAGYEPYSHIAALLPPEVPVVRVQSNFTSPGEAKGFNDILARRVQAHKTAHGRFALLIPPWQHQLAEEALRHFGLALAAQPCQKIRDQLYDDAELDLCPVRDVPAAR